MVIIVIILILLWIFIFISLGAYLQIKYNFIKKRNMRKIEFNIEIEKRIKNIDFYNQELDKIIISLSNKIKKKDDN